MAHYDCSNCGAGYGIDYGYCDSCTPVSVLNLKTKLEDARKKAYNYFTEEMSVLRDQYVSEKTLEIKNEYEAEFNKYKPKNK